MKKSIKLIFCEKKNDTQISGFAVVKKAPERKICWKKKNPSSFTDKTYKMMCRNFLKINGSQDI